VRAVDAVKKGKQYLSSEITDVVVDKCLDQFSPGRSSGAALGPREREVLQLVAEGKSSKEIGFRLKISARTVEVHRRHIMEKLDLHSSAELTKYAVREGMTPLDS
jgi:DNA-binding NarL/FixJ family response regulator